MFRIQLFWVYVVLFSLLATFASAATEYTYSYVPKKVYENQIFPITLLGSDPSATFTFDKNSAFQPLFKKPLLVKNGDETFYTFYFKALKESIHLPRLFVHTVKNEISLEGKDIPLERLAITAHENFSNVLATGLKIKGQQVSNYDTKNHIVTLLLEGYAANMEDMSLPNVSEFGIENIKRENAKVTAEFYAVLPREQKRFMFSYYNTIKQRFITLNISVEVADASVTTQSDLNPKVDAFERLKRYALILFSLFFIVMFVWKKDFLYLILGIISLVTLLTFYIPHKKICVKQGAPLYIIPTNTSTIGTRIDNQLDTMLLGTRSEYNKIEYKKGIIGWIKNEDICDN